MKNINIRSNYFKAAAAAFLLAAWVSIPALISGVKADGTPLVAVRTATLAAPSGTVNPHGEATWELYQSGNRELEVEVEDLNLPQGTVLTSFINGNNVGSAAVDDRGRSRLRLKTEDGQAVPVVNDGSTCEVRNGATLIVSGIFGGGGATPTAHRQERPRPRRRQRRRAHLRPRRPSSGPRYSEHRMVR